MKILGIDFGLKKIGLALSEGELVEPLAVIENRSSVISRIVALCQHHKIEKLVMGTSEGKIAQKIRRFGKELSRRSQLPVVYQDETLTTREAIAKMIEAGKRKKYRQKREDAFAAALILQSYLERLPPPKRRIPIALARIGTPKR